MLGPIRVGNNCCCPGDITAPPPYNCTGGHRVPGLVRMEVEGYAPCILADCVTNTLWAAPLDNGVYSLSRYWTGNNDLCPGTYDCQACYRLGTLTPCDIADLHGIDVEPDCLWACDQSPCLQTAGIGTYKFIKTTNCDGTIIDSYMSLTFCGTFQGDSGGVGALNIQWIHVLANTTMYHSQGVWNTRLFELTNNPGCQPATGGFPCCELGQPTQSNSCAPVNFELGPSPGYTSDPLVTTCCGDFTVTLGAI